jgi:hypothetical protein
MPNEKTKDSVVKNVPVKRKRALEIEKRIDHGQIEPK